MSSCEEWPASPASFGPLRYFLSPSPALLEHHRLELLDAAARSPSGGRRAPRGTPESRPPCRPAGRSGPGNCRPRRSAPRGRGCRWREPFSCSLLSEADSVLALWSMSSAACSTCWVACSVPRTIASSSRLARDMSGGNAPPPENAATSSRLRLSAAWISLELGLVGVRLGDLRARLLHRLAVRLGARLDQAAQRLDLGHELVMAQRRFGLARGHGRRARLHARPARCGKSCAEPASVQPPERF